ncbi:MAG: hypothetical protein IT395_01205 [Candidatus Omnitrophica bacterium]|nr:hypothetical protein [Candidatus Omnitrophota bacterium]
MSKSFPLPKLTRAQVFLAAAGALVVFNLYTLTQETFKTVKLRQRHPYTFFGDRFRGIETFVGQAPYLGYYTDKNIEKDSRAAMQYAQAQLVLAPSILDLNNTGHEFIIFDCTTPQAAMAKIKEIGAKPLKANPYGIILAQNTDQAIGVNGDTEKTFDKTLPEQKQRP